MISIMSLTARILDTFVDSLGRYFSLNWLQQEIAWLAALFLSQDADGALAWRPCSRSCGTKTRKPFVIV